MSEPGEYVPSPRPNPRLRPEGAAYAERNRGTMERWFDYSDVLIGDGDSGKAAAAAAAVAGSDSQRPSELSEGPADNGVEKTAQMKEDNMIGSYSRIQLTSTAPTEHPSDTTLGGGEASAADSAGEAVRDLTEKCSELSLGKHRSAAEEAKEYAERNRGKMDNIINNYGVTTPPAMSASQDLTSTLTQGTETEPPSPTPPMEASMSPRDGARQRTLHLESQEKTWDETRPAPRIRPDGESIAMKNSSDSMFDIMRTGDSPQSSPVKIAHSPQQTQESAAALQSANQPRMRPGEGMKNYERAHDQSEMAAILRGEGDSQHSAPPRNIRHLQRSELW